MIDSHFGLPGTAEQTLERYSTAILQATLDPMPSPSDEYRQIMSLLSEQSCAHYRALVYKTPEFIDYFQTATPINELSILNIGSRPSKRKNTNSVDMLRAIPWVFAWTQNRCHLPVWLGIAPALMEAEQQYGLETLQRMYQTWPFFRSTIDLIQMVGSSCEQSNSNLPGFGQDGRQNHDLLRQAVGAGSLGAAW